MNNKIDYKKETEQDLKCELEHLDACIHLLTDRVSKFDHLIKKRKYLLSLEDLNLLNIHSDRLKRTLYRIEKDLYFLTHLSDIEILENTK